MLASIINILFASSPNPANGYTFVTASKYMHVTVGTYSAGRNGKNGAGPNNRYPILKVAIPNRSSNR